jgi:hypothetical protein
VAARRLVIVMLVLLAISTLAAALLPPPKSQQTAPPPKPKPRPQPSGKGRQPSRGLLLATRMRVSERPKTVRVERGDQLRLSVSAPSGESIEIFRLGLVAPATAFAAAEFDVLATDLGTYSVQTAASGRLVGRLLVGKPGTGRCGVTRPEAPPGSGSARSCSHRERRGSKGSARSAPRP